jgi:hypothetical protein
MLLTAHHIRLPTRSTAAITARWRRPGEIGAAAIPVGSGQRSRNFINRPTPHVCAHIVADSELLLFTMPTVNTASRAGDRYSVLFNCRRYCLRGDNASVDCPSLPSWLQQGCCRAPRWRRPCLQDQVTVGIVYATTNGPTWALLTPAVHAPVRRVGRIDAPRPLPAGGGQRRRGNRRCTT